MSSNVFITLIYKNPIRADDVYLGN